MTYVADFDEVEMNGHRFAHANCGSEKTLNQKALVPGCKIEVSLHGDVIVCVDGKVEDEPTTEDEPIIEEEPIIENEEPIIEEEPHVIEQDIHQGQEQDVEPEPMPQPKPKRKRNYPQVGEPTLQEKREDDTAREDKGVGVKAVLAGVLAVLMAVSTGVVMLALAGAAVLFMPMLGGVNEK